MIDLTKAIADVKDLDYQLQQLDNNMFNDGFGFDIELETGVFDAITEAQKKCMVLWDKLVKIREAQKSQQGCKVRKVAVNA